MSSKRIVFLRHGPKMGEALDVTNKGLFKRVAGMLVDEFGADFHLVTSNVERSVHTGVLMEKCVQEIAVQSQIVSNPAIK